MRTPPADMVKESFLERHTFLSALLLISVLAFIAFGGGFRNGFVWDDETFIANNEYVKDISRLPQYFTVPESISNDPVLSRMYRPLQTLSFAIDEKIWSGWAGGFHITSLLLHIASCIAIIFAFRMLIGAKPAVIAASIFAVHPALSESVLSLASRGNQLYTFFLLLSLGFFVRIEKPFDKKHIFSILIMMLALFSKEPAIAFIAMLPFIQAAFSRPLPIRSRETILLYAPFLLAAVFYIAVRAIVVDTEKVMPYWGGSLWATIQMQAKAFAIYLSLLIWPFNLKGRYSIAHPALFPDFVVIAAVILNVLLIIFAVIFYFRGEKGKFFSLAVVWFYISLLPVSNLIPVPGSMMGERFIYFTFAGMTPFIIGAFNGYDFRRYRIAGIVLTVIIFTAWITKDISRTSDWKDNKTFFTILSEQEPDNPVIQIWMAKEDLESGDASSALKRLERIINAEITSPMPEDRAKLHYWYGKALLDSGRAQKAYEEFSIVRRLTPGFFQGFAMIFAEAAARSGNIEEAYIMLEQALQKSPGDDSLLNAMGNVLTMKGDTSRAISFYKNALEINPKNKEAAVNLQRALKLSQGSS